MTVKGDYKALDALLADDLIYVHSNGNVDNEKTFLEGLTSGRSKYHSIEPIDMKARALGDLVFIDGRAKVKVESNGQVNDLLLTYLDVWAKRNGTWQMVHWHSARMPPPAPRPRPSRSAPKPVSAQRCDTSVDSSADHRRHDGLHQAFPEQERERRRRSAWPR